MSYADCTPEEIDLMENAFGDHIRRRREQLGLSARDVSSRCGVPPTTLNQIEAGQQPPDLERVPSLANALELDPAALCRLALLTAYPLFYGLLTAEPDLDLAAAFDPGLSTVVEVDAEEASWGPTITRSGKPQPKLAARAGRGTGRIVSLPASPGAPWTGSAEVLEPFLVGAPQNPACGFLANATALLARHL